MTDSDAALVERVQRDDDRQAFAALVRRHQGMLRAYLARLCQGQTALADDLAQESFLKAYRALPRYRSQARFSTWLVSIARNAYLDHARKQGWQPPLVSLEADEEGERPDVAAPAVQQHLSMDMERAVARLSAAQREVIVHCYFGGLTHEEAAQLLGCPIGTLKSHLNRALARLRELLHDWKETPP